MKSVCWFRNDLRVLDNPALHHCCKNSADVIAVYFINRTQWQEHDDAIIKINFWLRNLEELKNKLENLNIPLVVLEAENYLETASVLRDFCVKNDVKNLYFNNEYPINELERDRNIYQVLKTEVLVFLHIMIKSFMNQAHLKLQRAIISLFIVHSKENGLQSLLKIS